MALLAVEDKVGAHLQQAATGCGEGLSKRLRGARIHGRCQLGLAFRLVHRRVGAGIQHPVRTVFADDRGAGLGIGEIQFGAAAGDQLYPRGAGGPQGLAQLAVLAGKQHLQRRAHRNTSPDARASVRLGAAPSLPANCGSAPFSSSSGQAIATLGSSQRSERSLPLLQ